MINVLVAFGPVVAFLAALVVMDSFKLVKPSAVLNAIAWGAAAALVCLLVNAGLIHIIGIPSGMVSRYLAPPIEEAAKAAFIVTLIARRRVGFLVDAALQGFAVGTGFALVENLSYLGVMPDATIALWFVRGLGTAVLQGTTTALFAMLSKVLVDRHPDRLASALLPGAVVAVVIHSAFNHRLLPPVAQTLLLLIALPLLVLAVYTRSERATSEWIGAGLDLDLEVLQLMLSEHFGLTQFGRYLGELRTRLPGHVVVDMFCLLRLELELSIQAKALLMARQAGVHIPADDDLREALAEYRYLEHSIGATGLLALKPLRVTTHRDNWHQFLLKESSGPVRRD